MWYLKAQETTAQWQAKIKAFHSLLPVPHSLQSYCCLYFSVCVYMYTNVITLWISACRTLTINFIRTTKTTRPSLVHSRETSHTGPTYAPSKHTKCAKTQKVTAKSNKCRVCSIHESWLNSIQRNHVMSVS